MISYIVLSLVFITFLLACYEDIKKREVYDYLNFSFVLIILIISAFDSMITGSFDPLKFALFGTIIGFGLGAVLFYMGIWGGGDAKFLLGFSASTYYIKDLIVTTYSNIGFYYDYSISKLNVGFELFLNTFLSYITILDIIFLSFIVIQFLIVKRKSEKHNLLTLGLTLGLLLIGLYFNFDPLYLIMIAFMVFLIIFFAKEGAFDSVYFKYKKHLKDLAIGDKISDDIRIDSNVIVSYKDGNCGLSREQLHKIDEHKNKKTKLIDFYVQKSLPFSILILLNFVVYLIKIITLHKTNLEILSFMFKYLFFSFVSGGILAVGVVFYYFIKHYKKIKLNMNKYEWAGVAVLILLGILSSMYTGKVLALLLISPLYLFVKMAIAIETVAFVSKKDLDKIVLGDWIVQNIYDKDKLIYDKSDFKIGVDEFQLAKIKKLAKHDKKLNHIKVKDGIAFLPALFIGFLALFYFK